MNPGRINRGITMKSGFKDPIQIKDQKPKDKPVDGKNSPWDFRAPEYDQRTSCFVKAGVNYGVGNRNKVGHEGNGTLNADTLPFGHVDTMKTKVD